MHCPFPALFVFIWCGTHTLPNLFILLPPLSRALGLSISLSPPLSLIFVPSLRASRAGLVRHAMTGGGGKVLF